jgi:hypothetical protein
MALNNTAEEEEYMSVYQQVQHEDCTGTLFVSDSEIRFQPEEDVIQDDNTNNNTMGLFHLAPKELVNVSASCFPVQKLFVLNVSSFSEDDQDSYLTVFHMANGVDLVRAKDRIESLLKNNRKFMPCGVVSEKLAEHQEAQFYAF